MTFEEWLDYGQKQNWCSQIVCDTHEGIPMSSVELSEFEITDPCIHALRVYESAGEREAVLKDNNHG